MKYAIVIFGGATDAPQPELDGLTPLQHAHTPELDRLAQSGRVGQVRFVSPDCHPLVPPGVDGAFMSLLGYDPARRYPGHAPLNAMGHGVAVQSGDWVFNLSLLSVIDEQVQPTTGIALPRGEAEHLVRGLLGALDWPGAVVHDGPAQAQGAPIHLLVDAAHRLEGAGQRDWSEVVTQRPDDIAGQTLRKAMPLGGPAGERLQQLIHASQRALADHELNHARKEMGEPPITHLWPWGQGMLPPNGRPLKAWRDRFGKSAVVISPDSAVRGAAILAGLETIAPKPSEDAVEVLDALSAASREALGAYDLVIVHTDAPQCSTMMSGLRDKVNAIQQADTHLLASIHEELASHGDHHRLLVTPLHTTQLEARREHADAVPFLIAGHKISNVVPRPMTEPAAQEADLQLPFGHELMEFFLKGGIR